MARRKSDKPGFGVVRTILLIAALCVLGYSAWQLFTIFHGYYASGKEYKSLADSFTSPAGGTVSGTGEGSAPDAGDAASSGSEEPVFLAWESSSCAESAAEPAESLAEEPGEKGFFEDAPSPLKVDWKELKSINPDVVGWIYSEGIPTINYPILRAEDNDYYLHRTFRGEYLTAGSIFEDYHNSPDFTDPVTIIYGHNMKDGSMFNRLKTLRDQKEYEKKPYFWILTPKGDYRYHIFSVAEVGVNSAAYTLFSANGPEFLKWMLEMKKVSEVKCDIPLLEKDKAVVLSTCTSDSNYRTVVVGKCVSSKPPKSMNDKLGGVLIQDEQEEEVNYRGDEVYGETYD